MCERIAPGDVDEALRAITAAIGTDELSEEFDAVLRAVQADLAGVRADPAAPDADRLRHARITRLDAIAAESEVDGAGNPVRCRASELLRLAAAATGRAGRAVRETAPGELDRVAGHPAVYLHRLTAVLGVLAERAEREAGRRIPLGACGNPWLHPALAPRLDG